MTSTCLQEIFNATRLKVWRQQPESFFDEAILDADGTMVETSGECKAGHGHQLQGPVGLPRRWCSRWPTRASRCTWSTGPGNRPSHEQAAAYFDRAIALCRAAGFRKILLRGDTDFTQTEHLDRWDDDGVRFIFGIDATANLVRNRRESAEKTPGRSCIAGRSTRCKPSLGGGRQTSSSRSSKPASSRTFAW